MRHFSPYTEQVAPHNQDVLMQPNSTAHDQDDDQLETREWQDALSAVMQSAGPERARFLLNELVRTAHRAGLAWRPPLNTPYVNTVHVSHQPDFPGGETALRLEERLASIIRWNALAMVVRANRSY